MTQSAVESDNLMFVVRHPSCTVPAVHPTHQFGFPEIMYVLLDIVYILCEFFFLENVKKGGFQATSVPLLPLRPFS